MSSRIISVLSGPFIGLRLPVYATRLDSWEVSVTEIISALTKRGDAELLKEVKNLNPFQAQDVRLIFHLKEVEGAHPFQAVQEICLIFRSPQAEELVTQTEVKATNESLPKHWFSRVEID